MTEHPILFKAPMVRAILEGRKTQTRRVVKTPEKLPPVPHNFKYEGAALVRSALGFTDIYPIRCPYGAPGDLLWVRETHARVGCKTRCDHLGCHWRYKADANRAIGGYGATRWTPSIHMPRWASRITLKVTDVRVERLQEISETDAADEGVGALVSGAREGNPDQYRATFRDLWSEINGADSWAANPWVWVVSFERQS